MEREELYYQLAQAKIIKQDSDNRDLEGKAGRSIAFAAAILGASVALNILPNNLHFGHSWYCDVLLVVTYASPIIISTGSLFALWPRKWRDDPLIDNVGGYITDSRYRKEDLIQWAGNQYKNAILKNQHILKQKAWAITTAYCSIVVLVLALLLLRVLCSTVSAHPLSNG